MKNKKESGSSGVRSTSGLRRTGSACFSVHSVLPSPCPGVATLTGGLPGSFCWSPDSARLSPFCSALTGVLSSWGAGFGECVE